MKRFFILILILSFSNVLQAKDQSKRKSNVQRDTQIEITKALRMQKNKSRKKRKLTKRKNSRKIASIVSGIKEQITALEARPKKTKKDYIAIAELYFKLKNYKKTISNLRLANKPQAIDVLDKLSRVYKVMGDNEEEIRALQLIRLSQRATPSQLTRLGDAYARIKNMEEAILVYRESIKKEPKYEKAYQGIFELYVQMKNLYDARLVVIEVLEKFGDQKYWLNEFCKIEIEQKYFTNAKKICPKAIAKDPKNPDNHVYLALAHNFTENESQARKIIFKAAKQFKSSEIAQWNAGQMSCSIKNWELAVEQFRQCVKADPESGRCHLNLGKAQYELKKYDEALASLMKACPYIKGVEVEIRRLSYDLEKVKNTKTAKKYMQSSDKCSSKWFSYAKKHKTNTTHNRNEDKCFTP